MKITIESTTKIVVATGRRNEAGMECRVWEGQTESGIKIVCLIPRIAVRMGEDVSQFEAELKEQRPPSTEFQDAFPLRMIL